MFQVAIVGLGPAGIFTLASLPDDVLPETLILEQSCIGGDLSSYYSGVIANITKNEFIVKTMMHQNLQIFARCYVDLSSQIFKKPICIQRR